MIGGAGRLGEAGMIGGAGRLGEAGMTGGPRRFPHPTPLDPSVRWDDWGRLDDWGEAGMTG